MGDNAFDFKGLFTIQKQYLADLSAISVNPDATSNYRTLSTKLNDLYNSYNTSVAPASSVALDHQNKMINIIEDEKNRLNQKKVGIDNAYATQQRLIKLNESYREKNMKYINILIVVIVTIIIYLALLIIGRTITFIPEIVIIILMGILFAVSFIMIAVMYANIQKHDHMDYQKLLFVRPPITTGNVYGNVSGNSIGFGIPVTCIGNACCGSGTTWNPMYGNCMVTSGTTSGFTLMGEACKNKNCVSCNGVSYLPYAAFEFDSYAKI